MNRAKDVCPLREHRVAEPLEHRDAADLRLVERHDGADPAANFCQTVFMYSSCIETRFLTKSAAPAPTEALSISMLTRTPPTGIPKSWNHWMKRVITAMGRASGRVTKKKEVFWGP